MLPDLPLPAAGFDAVTGNFVIHATGDPAAVLAELRRVLRAGGRLALTCWSEPPPPVLGIAREALEAAGVSWPPDIPVPPFRPYSSPGAFAALLAEAGFTDTAAQVLTWEFRSTLRNGGRSTGPAWVPHRRRHRLGRRGVEHGAHLRLMPRTRVVNVGLLKLGALPVS